MKTIIVLLLTLTATTALAQSKDLAQEQKQNQTAIGPIAGGGGYASSSSATALKRAASQLSDQLNDSADIFFKNLPEGWSRERLQNILRTIRISDKKPTMIRDGRELLLNYGRDEKGEYVEALRPFFVAYEHVPWQTADERELTAVYRKIQLLLLHEIGHLLNIGTSEDTDYLAEFFAKRFLEKLLNQYMICEFPENEVREAAKIAPYIAEEINSKWIINHITKEYLPRSTMNDPRLKSGFDNRFPQYWRADMFFPEHTQLSIQQMLQTIKQKFAPLETTLFGFGLKDELSYQSFGIYPIGDAKFKRETTRNMQIYPAALSVYAEAGKVEHVRGQCRVVATHPEFDYEKSVQKN